MIRLILLALLFFLGYTVYNAISRSISGPGKTFPRKKARGGEEMVQDPHCGTYIPQSEAFEKVVKGKRYYFCSRECRDAFTKKQ